MTDEIEWGLCASPFFHGETKAIVSNCGRYKVIRLSRSFYLFVKNGAEWQRLNRGVIYGSFLSAAEAADEHQKEITETTKEILSWLKP